MREKKRIDLIVGASHTWKTVLAQKLLRKYKYSYYSTDLLKIEVIGGGNIKLTLEYDDKLEIYRKINEDFGKTLRA